MWPCAHTRREAETEGARWEANVARGTASTSAQILLGKYLEEWGTGDLYPSTRKWTACGATDDGRASHGAGPYLFWSSTSAIQRG
jgi:hypothetical protein